LVKLLTTDSVDYLSPSSPVVMITIFGCVSK
jgi:hypothetical protein